MDIYFSAIRFSKSSQLPFSGRSGMFLTIIIKIYPDSISVSTGVTSYGCANAAMTRSWIATAICLILATLKGINHLEKSVTRRLHFLEVN